MKYDSSGVLQIRQRLVFPSTLLYLYIIEFLYLHFYTVWMVRVWVLVRKFSKNVLLPN